MMAELCGGLSEIFASKQVQVQVCQSLQSSIVYEKIKHIFNIKNIPDTIRLRSPICKAGDHGELVN